MNVRTARTSPMTPTRALQTRDAECIPTPPAGVPWRLEQRWEHVLFCHFPYPKAAVQPLVPDGLDVEERDGSAWVSVVPLHATHTHLKGLPEVLFLNEVAEVNVRTYVRDVRGNLGVYFLSIDIDNIALAFAARKMFGVAYHDADVRITAADVIQVTCRRGDMSCAASYAPYGDPLQLTPWSLEERLCERYALYVEHEGALQRGVIQHQAWQLHAAHAEVSCDELMAAAMLPAPSSDPWAFYARETLTHVWPLARV